jgi:chromosomal replication initiation ATPase DnaA
MTRSIRSIVEQVAAHHHTTLDDIRGHRRHRDLVAARHAAIWVLIQLHPDLTTTKLAHAVGLINHTSVIYAVRKIQAQRAACPTFAAQLDQLVERCRRQAAASRLAVARCYVAITA